MKALALLVALPVVVALVVVTRADAATYGTSCSSPPGAPAPEEITDDAIETRNQRIEDAANCAALAERIETLVAVLEAQDDATGSTAQRVALSAADRDRLDNIDARGEIAGVGVWLACGIGCALIVAPAFYRNFRWWEE